MDKIKVNVCLGTTCYDMDTSNLHDLNKIIPEKYGNKVEIITVPCMGLCSIKWETSKAPYVKVNETIIEEATVEKVLTTIDEKLKVLK